MSKSIYDEALKESKDFGAFVGLRLDRVNNALEQAKKQEKLLELYRELITVKNELIHIAWLDNESDETEELETDLEKRIWELENE